MGHVFADIELSNPRKQDLTPLKVKALVDTGALMLCIPEHIALQLNLDTESIREVSVADGRSMKVRICWSYQGHFRETVLLCWGIGSG